MMGYDISIGEATFDGNNQISGTEQVTLQNAPAYGEPTDYTNERWPSYSGWSDFMRHYSIPHSVVIADHPGYVKVTPKLKAYINLVYESADKSEPAGYEHGQNAYLVRLEWLKFWIDWALENCKNPIIYNS